MAQLDLKKLSRLDQVMVGAGVLALISLFLAWYGVSVGGFSASVSGWNTSYGWLGGLLIVAAGVVVLLQRSEVRLTAVPVRPTVLVLGLSLLGTVIVVLRWATLPSGGGGVAGVATYSYGPRVGIWITAIVGACQVVAAFKLFRDSGDPLPWSKPTSGQEPPAG